MNVIVGILKTIFYLNYLSDKAESLQRLEFRESDVSPGKIEVKQGKVQFIPLAKCYFRETYKSQNINPISPIPKFTLGTIQIKVKSLLTIFQWLVQ